MDPEDLELDDGRRLCPNDDCDWWVPDGMEYLAVAHDHD